MQPCPFVPWRRLSSAFGLILAAAWLVACGPSPETPIAPPPATKSTPPPEQPSSPEPNPPPVSPTPDVPPASTNTPPTAGTTPEVRPAVAPPAIPLRLPLYELVMDPDHVQALDQMAFSDETQPATFIADGVRFEDSKVRYRGAWARTWRKKPLKIFLGGDRRIEGHRRLNLNSGWRDPAFLRETLAYHVYAACGVPASRSRFVRVHLNGEFRGLYIEVEQPDAALLTRFGFDDATLFKAGSDMNSADERDLGSAGAYAQHYELETNESRGFGDLHAFCRDLARATDKLAFFESHLDVDRYINYLAATVVIQNWDAFNKNHFLVHDRKGTGKWTVIPWDLDRTFGDHWSWSFDTYDLPILLGTRKHPGVTGWNRLQDRFLAEPSLRARFRNRLAELLQTEFTSAKLVPVIDRIVAQIATDATRDRRRWPGPAGDLGRGVAGVKRFIEARRSFLLREIQNLR